jgi:hypothetical protein
MISIRPGLSRRAWLLATLGAGASRADPLLARLPQHISAPDPQLPYVQRLITVALARAGSRRVVRLVPLEMAQGRSLVELANGASPVDMMWTVTDHQREATGLIPLRIPIDRGLMGWRLLLVREQDLPRWPADLPPGELRQRLAGQGHDWPDAAILRANGMPVATSSGYDALFRMLLAKRFDYFPRSILEIDAELKAHRNAGLVIAPGLMIHYPAAAYLFVSPRQRELAQELLAGLEATIADGSFQQLHREHFGPLLRAHPIGRDRVLKLSNPLLPPETPLQRRELWLQPGEA